MSTSHKKRCSQSNSTPSHPSHLSGESNDRMVIKIHSSRNHASTDGLLEYRLEISPRSIVHLTEAGIRDIRPPPIDDLQGDDDENEDAEASRSGKNLPDPYSHFRVWIPACIVQQAEPSLVDDYEDHQKQKQEKEKTKKLTDGFKEGQSTKVIFQAQMSSPTTSSRIIDALDHSIIQTQSPRNAPAIARPFPATFPSGSGDPFADNHSGSRKRKARLPPSHSETNLLMKSPRKSATHTSPRSKPAQRKVPQTSSSHPPPSQIQEDAVIEISSDSDEEKRPTARARAKQRVKEQTIKKSDAILDLT